jgi:hypothetical protein
LLTHQCRCLIAKHARTQKHAGKAGLQARAVPAAVVAHFLHKVRAIEADVADILKQERTEKELRVAEMEANKASNLLAHRQAIAGRPARSWFQTEVQKRTVKNNWRDQREALDIGVREEGARTRKKKTRGEAKAAKRSEEKVCTAATPPPHTHTHRPGRFGAPGAGVCLLSAVCILPVRRSRH